MPTPTFELSFTLDNAAFDGPETRALEIGRILREVALRCEGGEHQGHCVDQNGNSVGSWGYDEADDEDEDDGLCASL